MKRLGKGCRAEDVFGDFEPGVEFNRRRRQAFGTVPLGTMPFRTMVFGAVMILGLFGASACRQPPVIGADVAVRIDGEELHYGEFEAYLRGAIDGTESSFEGAVLSQLFDQYMDAQLLIRLAIESGLVEPGVDERQAIDFLLRDDSSRSWTEAQLLAYYEAHESDYRHPEEVRLRQILVHERETAEQARAAIQSGESFVEAAARFSQGARAHLGGDQGRLARDDLPSTYVETLFNLAPGEVTDIIVADYGFHLFQVVERYPAEVIPFEGVRAEIQSTFDRLYLDEQIESFLFEARERYNVAVFPSNIPFDYQGYYVHHDTPQDTE